MKSFFGSFINDRNPVPSTILMFDRNISIGYRDASGANTTCSWNIKDIEVTYQQSTGETTLRSKKDTGKAVIIEGSAAFDFIRATQVESAKPWYQKSSGKEILRNTLLFTFIIGVLVGLYFLLVPWLSGKLAGKISAEKEKMLGNALFNAMSLESRIDKEKTVTLNRFFKAMHVPTGYDIDITVVNDEVVNAFALPGGHIVVYSALLRQVDSYPELAALLSHEFIHVDNRHATKSIFRRLGSKVFIALLFGKFGSVTSILIDHADDLKSLGYSRRLEKEADLDGLQLLLERHIDPGGFTRLFNHLKASSPADAYPEFLGSHPDIGKRITYIREASVGSVTKENVELKAIFDELK